MIIVAVLKRLDAVWVRAARTAVRETGTSLSLGTYRKLCYTFLPQIVSVILTKQSPSNHINVYSTNETKDCPISEKKRVKKKGRLLRHKLGMRVSIFLYTTSVFKYLEPNLLTDVIVACQIRCHLRFKAKNKKRFEK